MIYPIAEPDQPPEPEPADLADPEGVVHGVIVA